MGRPAAAVGLTGAFNLNQHDGTPGTVVPGVPSNLHESAQNPIFKMMISW